MTSFFALLSPRSMLEAAKLFAVKQLHCRSWRELKGVLYGSRNKQRTFPHTALTDRVL